MRVKLLCLSNGHGEDEVAVRILAALQQRSGFLKLAALPLVGTGSAYTRLGISVLEPIQSMPSGGFIATDGRQLVRDLRHGLLHLTRQQLEAVRNWLKSGGNLLAVGDIVPLLFAWWSGAPYAFIGTAKSEYYLRDEEGPLPASGVWQRLKGWSGSDYLPWERWLMAQPRCVGVFPRDHLTTETLKQWRIPAHNLGNPMMDGLESTLPLPPYPPALTILLLPGSRVPEAYQNWHLLLSAIADLHQRGPDLLFLVPIAPGLDPDSCIQTLYTHGWRPCSHPLLCLDQSQAFQQSNSTLILTQNGFNPSLQLANLAIAMAGTATEQFAGLGKPVITFPGEGPQFTRLFAYRQSLLLGPSVTLLDHPGQVTTAVQQLLRDPDRLNLIRDNGLRRLGPPGAADRIAQFLLQTWSGSYRR